MAPLSLGYLTGAGIFLAAFALTLTVPSKVDRFHSLVFWSVILDYAGGATVLTRLLIIGVSLG